MSNKLANLTTNIEAFIQQEGWEEFERTLVEHLGFHLTKEIRIYHHPDSSTAKITITQCASQEDTHAN